MYYEGKVDNYAQFGMKGRADNGLVHNSQLLKLLLSNCFSLIIFVTELSTIMIDINYKSMKIKFKSLTFLKKFN